MAKVSRKDRHEATKAYLNGPRPIVEIGPFCNCSQSPLPHEPHRDELPIFEYHRSLKWPEEDLKDKKSSLSKSRKPKKGVTTRLKRSTKKR